MSKGEAALAMMLRAYGVEHEREYRWLAGRRFRADFAIPWARLLIEVQGGHWVNGRHNRASGYEQDLVRQNLAQVHGWRMLQYTTGMVTSGEAIVQIMEMLSWLAPGGIPRRQADLAQAADDDTIGRDHMGVLVRAHVSSHAGRGCGGFWGQRPVSNPAELLAMLAEHGINLQHVPGGIPKLVALDVAGALGMMHDEAGAAMLLAKYTMDARATSRFRDYWRRVVDRRGYVERWPVDARQELLADYSLAEWMDAQRCRTCKGVGEQMTEQGRVQVCGACEGTGLRKIGLRAPARALGLSAEGFRKSPWAPRMDWCRRELQRRELTALAGLARRMARDD